jgi:hypothetical protein
MNVSTGALRLPAQKLCYPGVTEHLSEHPGKYLGLFKYKGMTAPDGNTLDWCPNFPSNDLMSELVNVNNL